MNKPTIYFIHIFNVFLSTVKEYLYLAKDKYGYNSEQALGMLFWHRHDLERATSDLANFTPLPDEWTVEDKVLFEQAFLFHGKSFNRIRQMVSHQIIMGTVANKSIGMQPSMSIIITYLDLLWGSISSTQSLVSSCSLPH